MKRSAKKVSWPRAIANAFSVFFTRSTLENPSTSLSEFFDGEPSDSGVKVNAKTAMQYSPIWRGVGLLARDVGKLPLVVYRRAGEGKARDKKHPAYPLLKHTPNPEMPFFPFISAITAQAILRGNGYAYIARDRAARPVELRPLDAGSTYPVRVKGKLWYVTVTKDGEQRKIPARNMLHIRGLTRGDSLAGMSLVEYAKQSLGLGIAAQKYGSKFFANNARPDFVLEHPNTLSDVAVKHLAKSWNKMHQGLDKAHKVHILEEGMKLNPYGMNNEDAQFLQTRQFEIREAANWLGLPPHKLGDTTRTAFASLEQENQSYLSQSLDPWLVAWECECWTKLLSEEQKRNDTHVVEFIRNALLRADLKSRANYYRTAVTSGWLSRDEVRAMENQNPIPDGEGAKFFIPLNMTTTGQAAAKSEDNRASERRLIEIVAERMCRRVAVHARKAAKTPDTFIAWLNDDLEADHRATYTESLAPVMAIVRSVPALRFNINEIADRFFTITRNALRGPSNMGVDLQKNIAPVLEKLEQEYPRSLAESLIKEKK